MKKFSIFEKLFRLIENKELEVWSVFFMMSVEFYNNN